jgi:hypothetical protein
LHEREGLVEEAGIEAGWEPKLEDGVDRDLGGRLAGNHWDVNEGEGLEVEQGTIALSALGIAGCHDEWLAGGGGLVDGGVDGGALAGVCLVIGLLEADVTGALEVLRP